MIIVIDGPEKAGKSTFAKRLKVHMNGRIRKWGPIPDWTAYVEPFFEDLDSSQPVIWDRAWPSEVVYSKLCGRDRPMEKDWWALEYYFGRVVQSHGERFMLIGPDVEWLESHRDDTDLRVPPGDERELFLQYGRQFDWRVEERVIPYEMTESYADSIRGTQIRRQVPNWRHYVGAPHASLVFVETAKRDERPPFHSVEMMEKMRGYGNKVSWFGFANTDTPRDYLMRCNNLMGVDDKSKLLVEDILKERRK